MFCFTRNGSAHKLSISHNFEHLKTSLSDTVKVVCSEGRIPEDFPEGIYIKKQYVVSCSGQSTLAGHSRSMLMEPLYCKSRPKSSIWRSKIDIFNFQKVKSYMGRTRGRRNASCHIFYEG